MKIRTNRKAFTLAEVLITLAIIGVIAALVIPLTISKINRLQVETGLPVAYQNIKQIITAAEQNEGPLEEWPLLTRENANSGRTGADSFEVEFVDTYVKPYIQGATFNYETFADHGYIDGIKNAGGSFWLTADKAASVNSYFVNLPNGMYLMFKNSFGTETIKDNGASVKVSTPSSGITIFVDINGLKKPNVMAKDIFIFEILSEKDNKILTGVGDYAIVVGDKTSKDNYYNAVNNGNWWIKKRSDKDLKATCLTYYTSCGADIMRNSWKIPDHHRWF